LPPLVLVIAQTECAPSAPPACPRPAHLSFPADAPSAVPLCGFQISKPNDEQHLCSKFGSQTVRATKSRLVVKMENILLPQVVSALLFRVPHTSSQKQHGALLGPGVYCTANMRKALQYCDGPEGGIIFQISVDLGRCKILEQNDPLMTTWHMILILHGHQRARLEEVWRRTVLRIQRGSKSCRP
jgi:hypothetical protein